MSDDFSSRESVEWNLPLDVFYLKSLLNIVATAIKYMTINNVWNVGDVWVIYLYDSLWVVLSTFFLFSSNLQFLTIQEIAEQKEQ